MRGPQNHWEKPDFCIVEFSETAEPFPEKIHQRQW